MRQVNVTRLHEDNGEALALAWLAGRDGSTVLRREAETSAAIVGHLNLTHPNSIQVIGTYEAAGLAALAERLFAPPPAALIVADGVAVPQARWRASRRAARRCSPRRCLRRASSRSSHATSPRRLPSAPSATGF